MAPSRLQAVRASRFRPHDWLDRFFEIAIIAKGVNGVAELIGGLLLLFVSPSRIQALAGAVTQGELSEDPHDFIATHLLHTTSGLTGDAVLFGAVYLMIHGLIKIVLVLALLLNKLWAYPWMIGVLIVFIGYQLYRIALHPTTGLIALTAFDAVILVLTCREYARQRAARELTAAAEPDPTAGSPSRTDAP
ncbi:DUF2127 domain-containing protein [Microlunatus ginsengisoli]|uniref:DUF2127 domain-containing protein n=1 Tax=Microlunatus ginsengisoli TaxID=363863 RepID=A0ABP6Z9G5_9ACTN